MEIWEREQIEWEQRKREREARPWHPQGVGTDLTLLGLTPRQLERAELRRRCHSWHGAPEPGRVAMCSKCGRLRARVGVQGGQGYRHPLDSEWILGAKEEGQCSGLDWYLKGVALAIRPRLEQELATMEPVRR